MRQLEGALSWGRRPARRTQMSFDCIVVGAGGHAAVVIDALRLGGIYRAVCVTEASTDRTGDPVLGVAVDGCDDSARQLRDRGITHFVLGVGAVLDNQRRGRLFERYISFGFEPATVVHPGACVAESASIGAGSVVLAGAIVNALARVGRNAILNTGSVVEHDCLLGDHVFIAPRACLGGCVSVGDEGFVGLGAIALPWVQIATRAVVGAGALVLGDVRSNETVMGTVRARSGPRAATAESRGLE